MANPARTLTIETAGEACSVALFDAGDLVAHDHRVLGRGHAETLVPMISALPERGRADRIAVSLGPGSFTGVRIGIAAARALGFAWNAQVVGYPTLALIAAIAREGAEGVTVCMNGGHGEWFVQNFGPAGPEDDVRSLSPDEATRVVRHQLVAGNRAEALVERMVTSREPNSLPRAIDVAADARCFPRLSEAQLSDSTAPIYGRPPDAKPQVRPGTAKVQG
ncbi:MAG: tRNA (adenosine(37)-N6)-threonylcarbamoyltransferase complex dimerization subunit type 1 TsaB [Erythrobacter sp.]